MIASEKIDRLEGILCEEVDTMVSYLKNGELSSSFAINSHLNILENFSNDILCCDEISELIKSDWVKYCSKAEEYEKRESKINKEYAQTRLASILLIGTFKINPLFFLGLASYKISNRIYREEMEKIEPFYTEPNPDRDWAVKQDRGIWHAPLNSAKYKMGLQICHYKENIKY